MEIVEAYNFDRSGYNDDYMHKKLLSNHPAAGKREIPGSSFPTGRRGMEQSDEWKWKHATGGGGTSELVQRGFLMGQIFAKIRYNWESLAKAIP